jgi:hypothetical protein
LAKLDAKSSAAIVRACLRGGITNSFLAFTRKTGSLCSPLEVAQLKSAKREEKHRYTYAPFASILTQSKDSVKLMG